MITSVQNAEIKKIVQLHASKGRREQQRFIAQGIRVLATLISAGHTPIALYATPEQEQNLQSIAPQTAITIVTSNVMNKISTATSTSGILGVFAIPKQPDFSELGPGAVLAQISDPGNMGTLIRTAAALNKKTVIIVEGSDPWSPKVVQATAGTIGVVNIYRLTWEQLLAHKGQLKLCALVVTNGQSPRDINMHNCLLVIGSEAHGLPSEWQKSCDIKLTIPMPGETESLNAAVAGSIALYLSSLPAA